MPVVEPAGYVNNEATLISAMLAVIGIDVRIRPVSSALYYRIALHPLQQTGTALILNGWIEDYDDPEDYCDLLLHSGSQFNIGGFSNRTYDRLVDLAGVTPNRDKRQQLYIQAQHLVVASGAFIPIDNAGQVLYLDPAIRGFVESRALLLVPRGSDWANVSVAT
jgi:ABC-type oligopeptide transport system substrate-binding subunit